MKRVLGRRDEEKAGPGALIEHAGWATAIAIILTATLVVLFALLYQPSRGAVSLVLIVGLGSLLSGWLLGFLFALPRSRTVAEASEQSSNPTIATIRPNTNLEEVSDWLTKIIVAVTLVQLGKIPSAAEKLFVTVGDALGGRPSDTVFAGSLIVACAIAGFVLGWMVTRIFLGGWMNAADANPAFEGLVNQTIAEGKLRAPAGGS